jgi:phage tail sheath protein FI
MSSYTTPGVYVEEVSVLPPSVAEVATAVPAFIGFTEKGPAGAIKVAEIKTLLDYEQVFGGPKASPFKVANGELAGVDVDKPPTFLLWYCLSHYFKNGGGRCYIVSVGDYATTDANKKKALIDGIGRLAQEDEPTLVVVPEAVHLAKADYNEVNQENLKHCAEMQDRFGILDVKDQADAAKEFRSGVIANFSYGAAYYPYLRTSLTHTPARDANGKLAIPIEGSGTGATNGTWTKTVGGLEVGFTGPAGSMPTVAVTSGADPVSFTTNGGALVIENGDGQTSRQIGDAWTTWSGANPTQGFTIAVTTDATAITTLTVTALAVATPASPGTGPKTLADVETSNTTLYNKIAKDLQSQRVVLPPSAAITGIYARTDRERGVWKAPANAGVAAVIEPMVKITGEDQGLLNVDPDTGKSINAIRAFAGKGTLVWGARTLAGNDNEWRYVNVRRLFIMIEESTKKATAFAVFEPNDATTWLKVKGMIESFLYGLWERGALQGNTPEAAYYVNVGLGKTMTTQDILEGRMIVEIGVAAVRPAEFIVLRFFHKLPEA